MNTVIKNRLVYLAMSVVMLVLGICMIAKPETSAELICVVIGIALLIISVIMIIRYFAAEQKTIALQLLLAVGIVIAIFGIFMLFRPNWIIALLHILIGIALLIDGIFKLLKALDVKASGFTKWWIVLLLAVVTCGLGLLLIFDPFGGVKLLMTAIGIILIVEGVQNIWVAIYAFRSNKSKNGN